MPVGRLVPLSFSRGSPLEPGGRHDHRPAVETAASKEVGVPYLSIRDLLMYYEESGPATAPPVMLLHGAGGTTDDPAAGWAGLAPTISTQFRTFAVEHRGHGRTNNPAGFMAFDQMGDDIAALIDQLALGAVHILGISDGGVIALDLALRRASLVRTVTTIGANYRVDQQTLDAAVGLEPETIERDAPEAAARFAARHDPGKYPGFWKELIRQVKDNNAAAPSWTVEDLRTIRCPTLLIAGELDPFANTEQLIVMKHEIPRAEWLIINHAGHAAHHEYPDFVGSRILDFLVRNSA
jgi:pimeloyl-ACP methyl ester carboxylesterase